MPRFRKAALEIASDYAKQLRRITVPRRLVREAPKPIEQRRKSWDRSACGYCKEPLPRKGLKFCGRRCYLRYSVEVAKPIEKAQARLAEMRAAGLNPGHGGEAARKRGVKIRAANLNHNNAVRNYVLTRDTSELKRFEGKAVRSGGRAYTFATDPRTLDRHIRAGSVHFVDIYVRGPKG